MKLSLIFAWFDFWIGVFYDRKKHIVYVFPIPMVGTVITLPHRWIDCGQNAYGMIVEQRCKCGEYRHHLIEHVVGGEIMWQHGKHPNPKTEYSPRRIAETAAAMGLHGHCFENDQAFAQNIAAFIEHPERIIPGTDYTSYAVPAFVYQAAKKHES